MDKAHEGENLGFFSQKAIEASRMKGRMDLRSYIQKPFPVFLLPSADLGANAFSAPSAISARDAVGAGT